MKPFGSCGNVVFLKFAVLILAVVVFYYVLRNTLNEIMLTIKDGFIKVKMRNIETVEEPQVTSKRVGKNQYYSLSLPGINEKDIHLKKLGDSIEIRAYGKDRMYFKLLPLKPNSVIVSKRVEGQELVLQIEEGE